MRLGPKGARLALGVLFFLSGVAALGIETTWLRWFRTLFGATAPAASATLVAFFAGHALGSAFAARWLPRARRPLRAYGLLELAAAGAALLVPILLALGSGVAVSVYPSLAESPLVLAAQRFALAIFATLPAAACYGATLPVLAAALIRDSSGLGTTGVAFYAANTAGAAIGAGLATFVLPEILGVRGSYGAAAALSLFAGTCALILARRSGENVAAVLPPAVAPITSPAPRATSRKRKAPPAQPPMTAAPANAQHLPFVGAALSGFVAFAAQVLLVQSFAQVLNGSIYAFGAVLVTVLIALALGAAVVATIETHTRAEPRALLAFALAVAGLTLAGFPQLLYLQTHGLRYVGAATPGAGYLGAALAATFVAAGPALLALAVLFPLCLALTARNLGAAADEATPLRVGRAVGRLAAVNTAGAIAGALAAPYLLLPAFGLWPSFEKTLMPFVNAVRIGVGLPPASTLTRQP